MTIQELTSLLETRVRVKITNHPNGTYEDGINTVPFMVKSRLVYKDNINEFVESLPKDSTIILLNELVEVGEEQIKVRYDIIQ